MRTTYTERLDNTIISVYNYTRKIATLLSHSDGLNICLIIGSVRTPILMLPARCFFIKYIFIISQHNGNVNRFI